MGSFTRLGRPALCMRGAGLSRFAGQRGDAGCQAGLVPAVAGRDLSFNVQTPLKLAAEIGMGADRAYCADGWLVWFLSLGSGLVERASRG